jgi:uncharacterized protein involved in exopolysaccharide biosynthesis
LDLVVALVRESWLMAGVALAVLVPLVLLILALPRTYTAESRLIVLLGQEYVFTPRVGDAGRGAVPQIEEVIQAEIQLLRSPVVAERALRRVGVARVFPDLARSPAISDEATLMGEARLALSRDFGVGTAPRTTVISTSLRHRDPAIAAELLNALLAEYLAHRKQVLVPNEAEPLAEQRRQLEIRLAEVNTRIEDFLRRNSIADFETNRGAVAALTGTIVADLAQAQARQAEAEGRLAALRTRLEAMPASVELFAETNAGQRLVDLQAERRQLLARYRPGARALVDVERRIAEAEAMMAGEAVAASGTVRRGANPARQELEALVGAAEGDARAARARVAELVEQRTRTEAGLGTLTRLQPEHQALLRERAVIEEGVRTFAAREQEARSLQALAAQANDNIRLIEPATAPVRGQSLRLPAFLAALVFAGLTGLVVGLVRALSRPGFPTAASAARTLGLPVLAVPRG